MKNLQLFFNANIFTADCDNPTADSMLVKNGIILWTGREAELPDSYSDRIQSRTNLYGRFVLPGFVDAHMHPVMLADYSEQIAALPPCIHSIDELIKEIQLRAKKIDTSKTENLPWILGWGYDENKYKEHRAPNRFDLDKGSLDYPVSITRTCAHILSVNSKALELAGIDRSTPDPEGGEIERDACGEPTGILKENARNLIVPYLPKENNAQRISHLISLSRLLASQGIVAVADMGSLDHSDDYDLLLQASKQGFLQKAAVFYMWDDYADIPGFAFTKEQTDRTQQIFAAGLKLIGDGSVSGQTAWMDAPYLNTDQTEEPNYGMAVYSDALMEQAISFCQENQCQLSVHAMGSQAIQRIINRIAKEQNWLPENSTIPHVRIEHVTDPREDSIPLAKQHKMAFVTQPIFMFAEIESYIKNLGTAWMQTCYPIADLLKQGIKLCISTDAPATAWAMPSDPFPNIQSAVTRTAYDGTDCGQTQRIDIETAILLYTKEAAEIAGFPNQGQLKAGYHADFIVLSENILEAKADEIQHITVQNTYIGGKCVFARSILC